MKAKLTGDVKQAKEIEILMQEWSEALHQKDAELMTHYYSKEAKVFDLGSQTEITIHAADGLAFLYGYSRITGAQTDDPAAHAWCRLTVCYQKIKDTWKVVHEHISMPIDFEQKKPALIMKVPARKG